MTSCKVCVESSVDIGVYNKRPVPHGAGLLLCSMSISLALRLLELLQLGTLVLALRVLQ